MTKRKLAALKNMINCGSIPCCEVWVRVAPFQKILYYDFIKIKMITFLPKEIDFPLKKNSKQLLSKLNDENYTLGKVNTVSKVKL